jgi:hypothetical protein
MLNEGEAKSTPLEILEEKRKILCEIIKDYDLNNIFNCDEIGNLKFFYKIIK